LRRLTKLTKRQTQLACNSKKKGGKPPKPKK
jgi:hypothetical protein